MTSRITPAWLYEVLIGAFVFVVIGPLRKRLTPPPLTMWAVIGLLAAGRFVEFYVRFGFGDPGRGPRDRAWTSVLLLGVAALGTWFTLWPRAARRQRPRR